MVGTCVCVRAEKYNQDSGKLEYPAEQTTPRQEERGRRAEEVHERTWNKLPGIVTYSCVFPDFAAAGLRHGGTTKCEPTSRKEITYRMFYRYRRRRMIITCPPHLLPTLYRV